MRITLIGNYGADVQESMLRYAELLRQGLSEAGHDVMLVAPRQRLRAAGPRGVRKWIGYIDKYILSGPELTRAARSADLVHVCDHSNAVYVPSSPRVPYVVTCHDLLAVRGALGEVGDCPASFMGRHLQRAILKGLSRAQGIACVSTATMRDAQRLLKGYRGTMTLVYNSINYPYSRLNVDTIQARLFTCGLQGPGEYVLAVGSDDRRKNRECMLRAVAAASPSWNGKLVVAGMPLTAEHRRLAGDLGIASRIVEVPRPDNGLLEALYNGALALLFPSRFEGFGWPVIEAQASGCPVICSDREPMVEVSGGAAILCAPEDADGFARAIVDLAHEKRHRDELVRRGLQNAAKFGRAAMIRQLIGFYQETVAHGKAATRRYAPGGSTG